MSCLAAVLVVSTNTPAHAAPPASAHRLVFVALPDAQWNDFDLSETPRLRAFLDLAAIASVSQRGIVTPNRVGDGAATVSAGARSVGSDPHCDTDGAVVRCADFAAIQAANARRHYGARSGALGDALARAGIARRVVLPVGDAALSLVDSSGTVPAAATIAEATAAAGTVVVVEGPSFHGVDAHAALAALEQIMAAVLDAIDLQHDDLLLATLAPPPGPLHLGVVALASPGQTGGTLRSATTDRTGVVQTADLAATVLHGVGVEPPASMEGRAAVVVPDTRTTADRVRAARALDADAVQRDRMLGPATFALAIAPLVLSALALVLLRWSTRPTAWFAALAGWVLAFPLATYWTPWFLDADAGQLAYWSCASAISIVIGTLGTLVAARVGRARGTGVGPGSVLGVCGLTAVVLVVDLLRGGVVQYNAVFGYSATVGGRFSGSGNMTTGFLAASVLAVLCVTVGAAAPGRRWSWWPEAVWVVLVVVVATPMWGSDVGGALFLVPTAVVWSYLRRGVRVRVRTFVAAMVGAVVLVAVLVAVDLARPADRRTHFGRILGGGGSGSADLGDVVARKAAIAWNSFGHTVWWWGLPALVVAACILARCVEPRTSAVATRHHAARATLVATVLAAVLGSLVNDSGLAVAGAVLAIALPAFVALAADTPTPSAPLAQD